MSKFYIFGGILCFGGLALVTFQAISSVMMPGEVVWKSINIAGALDEKYIKWIDTISWTLIHNMANYIVTMPLYILLLVVGVISFIIGGLLDK